MSFMDSIRHCSAAFLNELMRKDRSAVETVRAEEAKSVTPGQRTIFHPGTAQLLQRQRHGEGPHMPLSG